MARHVVCSPVSDERLRCASLVEAPRNEAAEVARVLAGIADPVRLRFPSLIATRPEVRSCDLEAFSEHVAWAEVRELTRLGRTVRAWEPERRHGGTEPHDREDPQDRPRVPPALAPLRRPMEDSAYCKGQRALPTPDRVEPLIAGDGNIPRCARPRLPADLPRGRPQAPGSPQGRQVTVCTPALRR